MPNCRCSTMPNCKCFVVGVAKFKPLADFVDQYGHVFNHFSPLVYEGQPMPDDMRADLIARLPGLVDQAEGLAEYLRQVYKDVAKEGM